jgi:SAP domain
MPPTSASALPDVAAPPGRRVAVPTMAASSRRRRERAFRLARGDFDAAFDSIRAAADSRAADRSARSRVLRAAAAASVPVSTPTAGVVDVHRIRSREDAIASALRRRDELEAIVVRDSAEKRFSWESELRALSTSGPVADHGHVDNDAVDRVSSIFSYAPVDVSPAAFSHRMHQYNTHVACAHFGAAPNLGKPTERSAPSTAPLLKSAPVATGSPASAPSATVVSKAAAPPAAKPAATPAAKPVRTSDAKSVAAPDAASVATPGDKPVATPSAKPVATPDATTVPPPDAKTIAPRTDAPGHTSNENSAAAGRTAAEIGARIIASIVDGVDRVREAVEEELVGNSEVPDAAVAAAAAAVRKRNSESASAAVEDIVGVAADAARKEVPADLVELVETGSLKKLTVTKLRRLLSTYDLKTTGRKAELIARLTSFVKAQ